MTDLGDRTTYIGGSDAASILGVSPWKSAYRLWCEKTGLLKDEKESAAMEWGTRLEYVVGKAFREKHPEFEVHNDCIPLHFHEKYPFIVGHLDGYVIDAEGTPSVLEIKTASAYAAKEWDNGVPLHYVCQVQHYMAVTGWNKAYVAVLIGGQDYREFCVLRDDEFIDKLIAEEVVFWERVQTGTPPPMSPLDDADLIPQVVEGKSIELSDEADKLIGMRIGLKAAISDNEDALEKVESSLKAMLGDAEIGYSQFYEVAWKKAGKGRTLSIRGKAE